MPTELDTAFKKRFDWVVDQLKNNLQYVLIIVLAVIAGTSERDKINHMKEDNAYQQRQIQRWQDVSFRLLDRYEPIKNKQIIDTTKITEQ